MRKLYTYVGWAVILLLVCTVGYAQTRTLTGKLVDPQSGEPMPGVSISVKGTTTGTVTNANGEYTITAPVGAILRISFIGYQTQEIVVPPLNAQEVKEQALLKENPPKTFHHTIPDSPDDKTLSPYFYVQSDDPTTDRLPLKSTSVEASVAGVIADVTVRQVYENEGKKPLEAIYIFPGSTRAAVYAMTMWVGERRIVAKIKEKEQARQEYNAALQAGKTASLLEQKRPNVFQMNVGNILPGDKITVEMHYTELLQATDGLYAFVYPTVVGPRYSETPDDAAHASEQWVQNPYLHEGKQPTYTFNLKTHLNAGMPVQKVFSPSHKINVTFTDTHTADIALDASETTGGNRDYVLRYRLRGRQVESGLLLHPGEDENFFLLMMQPPEKPVSEQIPPREYVFIVDVSGSMHGFPLEVSKKLMRNLLGNMRKEDRFNVILFAGTSSIYSSNQSVEATETNISDAFRFIDSQRGSGGTSLLPALQRALALKGTDNYARTFVLVSDGYVDVEKEAFSLVKNNLGEANFFAFGIGSSVNRYLMEGLAHAGMGEPFFVLNETEAPKIADTFQTLIENPVLTNIALDFGGMQVYDVEPAQIPDVFAERPIVVYGKYKGTPSGTIQLRGISGQKAYIQKIDVATARTEHNQALRYLWARERIKYWDDYAQFFDKEQYYSNTKGSHSQSQKEAVTQLGLKYNLLTAYTSFIAVDSTTRSQQPATQVNQPLPLPQGVTDHVLGNGGFVGAASGIKIRGSASTGAYSPVIGLQVDESSLQEVVVVGYGTCKRSSPGCNLGGCCMNSVIVQKSDAFTVPYTCVNNMIQGRLPSVVVTQNSGESENTTIQIRGSHSVALSNTPLYIVDGIMVDNSESDNGTGSFTNATRIADIPTQHIETIQVLKGPSAIAAYGSRGAHGVVLITTKTGKNASGNHPKVSVESSVEVSEANKLPKLQQEFAQGRPANGQPAFQLGDKFSWGPRLSDLTTDASGNIVPKGSPSDASLSATNPYTFLRNGLTYATFVSLSHRKNTWNWFVGAGHTHRRSIIPGLTHNRTTLPFNLGKTWHRFTVDVSGLYTNTRGQQTLQGNNPSGIFAGILTTPPNFDNAAGFVWDDGIQRRASTAFDNPYWGSQHNLQQTTVHRWMGMGKVVYTLHDEWKLESVLQADGFTDTRTYGIEKSSAGDPTGRLMQRTEQFLNSQAAAGIRWTPNLSSSNLELNLHTQGSYQQTNRRIRRTDETGTPQAGEISVFRLNQHFLQTNLQWLTDATASWKSRVTVSLSAVNEWTSTLGGRHLFSPSVGVGTQLLDVLGVSGSILNKVKLYSSYASVQKEAPLFLDAGYQNASLLNTHDITYHFERSRVSAAGVRAPETAHTFEVGSEIALWRNRITLEGSYFHTTTQNLYIPVGTRETITLQNGGTLRTKGWEGALKMSLLQNKAFRWNMDLNVTRMQSLVMSLDVDRVALVGFTDISSSLIAGQPYGVLYGTRYLRNEHGQQVIGADGFPVVDPQKGVLGNPNPDWTAGMEHTLSYKNFTLTALLDIRKGGVVWNGTQNTLNYLGLSQQSAQERGTTGYVFAGVTADGSPNTKAVDFVSGTDLNQNRSVRYGSSGVAEDAIQDASWVRLRNISLSYNFSSRWIQKLKLQNLSLSVYAKNLWLHTRYTGIDPETNLTGNSNGRGLDYFNLPNTRSFGLSLKVSL